MQDALSGCRAAVDACFDTVFEGFGTLPVEEGMRYAVNGGKRLRAFLVMEGATLHGVSPERSVWAAAAIEALHAYSLVHDDLPCMDDDDLRRGQPTVHKRWDETTAVLVGDALQTLAFELLTRPELDAPAEARGALVASLAKAAGARGMVRGQAQDIAAETARAPLTLDEITELQANKTGALIEWSARAGAILGGADPEPLGRYAQALGLAFQIRDDILDVEGDAEKTGKAVGKDARAGKATFVSLLGLEGAKARASSLVDEACAALSPYGTRAEALRDLARFVISRET
ncbi:polyprenyl synthetase family protein [Celeribacter indicus]|uniref:Geranylgeranyl diphosphate synthase n=1 Tax=Celeribacter indicus TaxID=1208324 RepID=A0A0B5DUW6_9RHOB|nr:farnesyl diphosphate synthase [Celeribacter indicus]AJE45015.1 geranyltranstransferase [Celeribacter indicus]SDW94718.1 farnesyl-diphosphate synthase [Celeribacter indicus]